MTTENVLIGIVNSPKLYIFMKPDANSEIICRISYLDKVEIDLRNSTDEFYKVCTAIGAEGFCQKELVRII